MRTTITLTDEAEALVRRAMTERDLSFKELVNAAIVDALSQEPRVERYETSVFDLDEAAFDAVEAVREARAEDDLRVLRLGGLS